MFRPIVKKAHAWVYAAEAPAFLPALRLSDAMAILSSGSVKSPVHFPKWVRISNIFSSISSGSVFFKMARPIFKCTSSLSFMASKELDASCIRSCKKLKERASSYLPAFSFSFHRGSRKPSLIAAASSPAVSSKGASLSSESRAPLNSFPIHEARLSTFLMSSG